MAKIQCNVISYTLRRTVDITVTIPTPTFPAIFGMGVKDGEKARHTPKEKYPVLYLLHGMGNNNQQWTGYTNVEMYAEEQQIVVVNLAGENRFYMEQFGDDFFTFVSEELPDFITGTFPVSERPEDTYIAGLSMGGFGTLLHAMSHPEKYCAFGVFSAGGKGLDPNQSIVPLEAMPEERIPWNLIELNAEKGIAFPKGYLAIGTEDHGYEGCKATYELLKEKGADVTWDEIEGYGHEWRFWDIEVEKFLKWLPRTDAYAKDGPRQI